MSTILPYGAGSTLQLDLAPEVLVAECGRPQGPAIADPARAIAEALDAPLDYPPLGQTAVPGDKIVLALDEGVPHAAEIVAAIVERLLTAGIAAADIALLETHAAGPPDAHTDRALAAALPAAAQRLVHDPLDRNRLSYLAASSEGKPVYIHRALSEADLVLPIGCLRAADALANYGILSGIFPAFSDAKTIERYRAPVASESGVPLRRFRREVEEAGWLLGLHYLVEVIPGVPDQWLGVLAGRASSVTEAAAAACSRAWHFQAPRRANLVLAAVAGPAGQQTWLNVARALAAASRVVEDGGTIVLCTELEADLGPALQALRGAEHPSAVMRHIAHERPADTLVAAQLAHALERGRVYLLSRLEGSLVEELGLAPIDRPDQVQRVAARHESCILLANAQYAVPSVDDESELSSPAELLDSLLEDAREEFE